MVKFQNSRNSFDLFKPEFNVSLTFLIWMTSFNSLKESSNCYTFCLHAVTLNQVYSRTFNIKNFIMNTMIRKQEFVPQTISYPRYFLRISKVWSMLHHGLVGRVQNKQSYCMFTYTFAAIFSVLFHQKICVFIIFVSFIFLDKYEISAREY